MNKQIEAILNFDLWKKNGSKNILLAKLPDALLKQMKDVGGDIEVDMHTLKASVVGCPTELKVLIESYFEL